jgi:predicted lipoprotein with Yx(FWY)xxD motif
LGLASFLSACGGDDDKAPRTEYRSSLTSSSSTPSSMPTSSSSSVVSSALASTSAAAISPPVALVDSQLNSADGSYLIARGDVTIALPQDTSNTRFTQQWANREGFTLYTFVNDTTGVSNCSGTCLANWPPLLASDADQATSPYSIIDRSLGEGIMARQWAYQGMPLYFFKNDADAGQTNGKAIGNWPVLFLWQYNNTPSKVSFLSVRETLLTARGWQTRVNQDSPCIPLRKTPPTKVIAVLPVSLTGHRYTQQPTRKMPVILPWSPATTAGSGPTKDNPCISTQVIAPLEI